MNISTDKNKIDELLTRGVENVYPTAKFLKDRLLSGDRLSLYCGYDPTAPTLHIGHGITMLKLRQFQDLGHKIIFLIGDFTGMIGDPTDKLSERAALTREQVKANAKLYKKQASAILNFSGENAAEIRYNSEWTDKLRARDLLELSARLTVPRLLERDMFQERLKQGKTVRLHEFLYPMFQGYDSVAMNVDGEIGGNDQTFNMLVGRELMKEIKGKEKFVLTAKLLTDTTGKKMGKSEGNMVAFTDAPEEMFGKVMSWTDEMIEPGFELCTRMPMADVKVIKRTMTNPRDRKLALAYEVTRTFLGGKAAEKGRAHFERVVQGGGMPSDIPALKPKAKDIVSVLVASGFVSSKSDARRSIDGGGVKINGRKIDSYGVKVKEGDTVQKGKRFFVKIV